MAVMEPRSNPSSVERAIAWIDAANGRLAAEAVPVSEASGRVLAEDICAAYPIPSADCAALDGFAVRARETLGAGAYHPIVLAACLVAAGGALPEGTDAVVPLEHAEPQQDAGVAMVEAVAAGDNVHRRGAIAGAGAILLTGSTRLGPRQLGLLACARLTRLLVVRRPRVRIVIAGSVMSGAVEDSDGPMIRAAVERDGGLPETTGLADAFAAGADIVLVIGGTGPGAADKSATALAASGELSIRGVALRPGETAGIGRTAGGTLAMLLPGAPAACLWTYEMFAGRAIRRMAGRDPRLPFRRRPMTTARKIVSAVGLTEICAVRYRPDGAVEPTASFAETGLKAAVEADGFVIVSETSEGHPAGSVVDVYLYDDIGTSPEARA